MSSTDLSAADIHEYESRVARARELARAAAFDAIVVADNDISGRFVRFLSGFHISPRPANPGMTEHKKSALVLPLSGEATLVVPPGFLNGIAAAARLRTWVRRIESEYSEDPAEQLRTHWGSYTTELGGRVAKALKDSGLGDGRIGIVGTYPGIERTKSLLPSARLEPAVSVDADGVQRSLLEPLSESTSPWELARLEHSMRDGDRALRAFIDKAQEGALIREAHAEMYHQAMLGGSVIRTAIMVGTEPWFFAHDIGMRPTDSRFAAGDLVSNEYNVLFDGYSIQNIRSFVVGKPSSAQTRALEVVKAALDVMTDRIEVGMTGEDVWNFYLESVSRTGLEPWCRAGHYQGYWHGLFEETKVQFMPGNTARVLEGQAVVLHPCLIDKATGVVVMQGNTGIMHNGRFKQLSSNPVGYGLPDGS